MKKEHPVKIFVCDKCPYSTNKASNLKKHKIRLHGFSKSATFKCRMDHCLKLHSTQEELWEHMRNEHPVKKFVCDKCPYSSNGSSHLKAHKIARHGLSKSTNFLCRMDRCYKLHSTEEELLQHMRNEHVAKKFVCDKCPYSSNMFSHLTQHKIARHGL